MNYTFRCDGKNDKFEIEYTGTPYIQEIHVAGSAMMQIVGTRGLGLKLEKDIGAAQAEYLSGNNISSLKEDPVFILLDQDKVVVGNAYPVTPELKEKCKSYIDEPAT